MEVVIAVLFTILANGNLEMLGAKKIDLDTCISEARQINGDPDSPFLLLCGPDLSVATHEG